MSRLRRVLSIVELDLKAATEREESKSLRMEVDHREGVERATESACEEQ